MHAVQLGLASPRLAELGTALLVIVPARPDQALKIARLVRASFPVLADPGREAFRNFGLGRRLFWQRSGSALVDRGGALAYILRSTSPRRALDLDALLRAAEAAGRA